MKKLSYAISKVIVNEYGQHEFLRRLADPLWFQAFGCVLGFDWHSSGVTTVVTGVLKHSLNEDVHGVSIAGGKGKRSRETKNEIPNLAKKTTIFLRLKWKIYCTLVGWQQKWTILQYRMVFRYITM
jgi:hypothetical protein